MRRLFLFLFLVLTVNTVSAQTQPPPVLPPPPKPAPRQEAPVHFAGIMPVLDYPGGAQAWLSKNIVYPRKAIRHEIEGKVTVSFIVEKDGSISDVKVIKSAHELLDSAAIDAVKRMPLWKPGTNMGKIVRVKLTLPVLFKIDNKSSRRNRKD